MSTNIMNISTPAAPAQKNGVTTTEFWTAAALHVIAALVAITSVLHINWSHGIGVTKGLVPVGALLVSAVVQVLYTNRRTALKIEAIRAWVTLEIHKAEALAGGYITTTSGTQSQSLPVAALEQAGWGSDFHGKPASPISSAVPTVPIVDQAPTEPAVPVSPMAG
jgi:hypothetical protein